jgi:hypothetical protein
MLAVCWHLSISRGVHLVLPYFSGGLLVESGFAWDFTGF